MYTRAFSIVGSYQLKDPDVKLNVSREATKETDANMAAWRAITLEVNGIQWDIHQDMKFRRCPQNRIVCGLPAQTVSVDRMCCS
jgi:hypothetical protein